MLTTVTDGETFTIAVAVPLHPLPSVPVTVYVVVEVGFADTATPVEGVRPAVGVQLYVVPPFAVKLTAEPPGMTSNDYITNVTLGTINNTTGASASPFNTYYSTMNTNLTAGSPYTVTGTINNGGTEGIAAWIDYNQNGVFEASEKIGQQTGLSFSLAFTVPASAYNGVTRLRVRNVYNNTNIDPCLSYTYGEIEDYNVTISAGVDPFTYNWSPGTFLASTTGSSVVASNVTATTTYTLTAVSSGGCSAYGTTTVNVNPLTAVNVNSSNGNAICAGGSSTLTATPVGGGAPYAYTWSSGETTAAITATPTVTTTYTVSVTDNCGATVSSTFALTVNPLPVVSVTPTSALYCSPSTAITLTASGASTYSWSPAAGLSATTGTSVDATPTTTTTYTVVGTDVNGCIGSATTTITSSPAVTGVTATATPGTVCSGSPVALASTADPLPVQILSENFNGAMTGWTTTNATTLGTPAATAWTSHASPYTYPGYATFNSNDASTFMLSNSDAGGSGNLTNTTLASPSFSTVNMATCSLSFFHYYYDYNGADSAMIQVSTDGTTWNTVKKYTTTVGSASTFAQDNVSLNAYVGQPTVYVRFYYRATWGYFWAIDNVAINATTTSTLNYSWTGTPGTFTASTQNATDNPTANTTYTVTVTAPSGCSATASTSVTVNPLPTIAAGSDVSACPNVATTLTATGGTSYMWNTGASTASINVMPTSTTTYTVTGTDGNGCMNTDEVAINVLPGANAGTITGPSEVCTGLTATLSLSGSVGTLQWYESTDNNSFTAIGGATSATLTTGALTDTMYYGLVAINGTCSDTTTIHAVNVLNNIVASVSSTNALCNGTATGTATVNISSGVGPYTYSWNTSPSQTTATATGLAASTYSVNVTGAGGCTFNGGAVITEPTAISTPMMSTNPSCFGLSDGDAMVMPSGGTPGYSYSWNTGGMGSMIAGLGAGTYTVTVTDANGCTATGTATLVDPAAVVVTISGNDTICSGASTTLTASGATTYTWNTTATGNTITVSPTTMTTYSVIGNVNGCTDTATVNVTVDSPVVAGMTYTPNGLTVDFVSTSTNAVTYAWDFGDGSTSNSQNPTYTYASAGTYNVQLIASNSCGNDTTMQTIVITSAGAIANAASLNVYPNPSKDVFRITFTDNTAHTVNVKIMAASGQVVMEESVEQFNGTYSNNVDLSKFAKGVYSLQITTNSQVMTRRVVLN